jgi:hypothetical protein
MNKFKQIIKGIYMVLKELSTDENKEIVIKFGENIRDNVELVMKIAGPIMESFGFDLSFKTRGVESALLREIVQEIELEEQSKALDE